MTVLTPPLSTAVDSSVDNPFGDTVDVTFHPIGADIGCGDAQDTTGEPILVLTAAAAGELRDMTRVRWAGWLAPIGERAGDLRAGLPMPTNARLKTRQMPIPFFWQKETTHGGQIVNGAREVGAVTYADLRPRPDCGDKPWIWGSGFIDLNESDGVQFARRLDDGMSRWISVKLDFDPEFEPPAELVTPREGEESITVSPTSHPDWWRLMNVTAEPQPAFDGAEVALLDDIDEVEDPEDVADHECGMDDDLDEQRGGRDSETDPAIEEAPNDNRPMSAPALQLVSSGAEVNAMSTMNTTTYLPPTPADHKPAGAAGLASGGSGPDAPAGTAGDHGSGDSLIAVVAGDTNLPIADRDHAWDGPAAEKRLIEWAGGRFSLDVAKMAKVHLYRDTNTSPKMVTSWKFPIADVIGGQVKIIPRGVFAAAAVLRGAMGGTKIPNADQQAMKGKINTLYARMAKQFNDPKIRSPFEAVVSDAHAAAMRDGDSAPDNQPPWRRPRERKRERRGLPRLAASASSWAASVAARVPDEPPPDWFTDPNLTRPSKIRVTDEGRIYGHVAAWHTEHAAFPGVHPPRNRDKTYSKFHRHPVRCADGAIVKTGPLATGGHTTTDVALAIESVQAHYDDPRYVVGDVVCGEDAHGIWVSGSLRPGVSPFQVMLADRYSFSGDWRYGELLAACSVSVPGFHLDATEEVTALTAAAASAGCEDIPVVAEAVPAVVADASGAPAVLIAAGIVVEDEPDDVIAEFTAAIDGLGTWLQQELATLRAEFGMTTETTTSPATEEVISQLRDLVSQELNGLRSELGLSTASEQPAPDTQPDTQPGEGTPEGVPEETPAVPEPAPGGEPDGNEPAPAPESAPTTAAADTVTASAAAPAQPTPVTVLPQVQQFQQWLSSEFAALRAERPTNNTQTASPEPVGTTVDLSAERRALLADVHGDELTSLFSLVHGEAV